MKKEIAPKEKLFQAAAGLFYQHGYRAIGVDTLAAESGIGKMTLYRHYPSKDALIVAYLKDSDGLFWNRFEQITKDATTPREKLLAFFESLQEYVKTPQCYGCPFLNVATEYPEMDYPGHQVALEHKQRVRAEFRQLAKEAGAREPEALADQLFLLMDGAYMAARMFGTRNPASHLGSAAKTLIDAQIQDENTQFDVRG
jgi:AcrR family transcriptional regulator